MLEKQKVKEIISIYKEAWEKKDTSKVLTIFSKNAIYHERMLEKPFQGYSEIKKYWDERVVQGQNNIDFKLSAIYVDKDTAIVEWDVKFDDLVRKVRKHLKEIAVLTIYDGKISSFREYWDSKDICNTD